jgi:hypothetical protein
MGLRMHVQVVRRLGVVFRAALRFILIPILLVDIAICELKFSSCGRLANAFMTLP